MISKAALFLIAALAFVKLAGFASIGWYEVFLPLIVLCVWLFFMLALMVVYCLATGSRLERKWGQRRN